MSLNTQELRNPALREFADEHLNKVSKLVALGAPILADVDRIVTSANMKVGTYTVAAQPDVTRNITVTATAGDTSDTMGTITVVGTDYFNQVLSEVITPVAGSTIAGKKAFKTVASVTGAGWVIDGSEGTNDTITIGVGTVLGMPFVLKSTSEPLIGIVGTAFVDPTVKAEGTISESTVDISSGTFNGTKKAFVFVVE